MTMDLPVIILGAGGHAKVLIEALLLNGRRIIGAVDKDINNLGRLILGVETIGDDETVLGYPTSKVQLVNGLGSVTSTRLRENLFVKFIELGYQFTTVVHPSAIVSPNVQIIEGAQIMAGAVIQTNTSIGTNSIINTRATVDHDCIIGDHVHIAPGAVLSGGVRVGNNVHIGTGAVIIHGINIGHDSLIAAGSVVVDDVPPGVAVMGVPGKVVRR